MIDRTFQEEKTLKNTLKSEKLLMILFMWKLRNGNEKFERWNRFYKIVMSWNSETFANVLFFFRSTPWGGIWKELYHTHQNNETNLPFETFSDIKSWIIKTFIISWKISKFWKCRSLYCSPVHICLPVLISLRSELNEIKWETYLKLLE